MITDPGHRQVREQLVAVAQAVELGAGARRPHQVVVAQHCALGPSGGARGVEHDGVVAALSAGDLAVDQGRLGGEAVGAALLHRLVGQHIAIVPKAARIDIDHDLEPRQPAPDLQELVDLLLVLADGEAGAGMLDDIGELVSHRILVDRHRDAAQRLGGTHRPIQPRPVVADHDQAVAAAEAQIGKAGRQPADLVGDPGPAIGLPDAVFLLAIGRPVGTAPGAHGKQLGKRVAILGSAVCRWRRHRRSLLPVPAALVFCLRRFPRSHSHSQFAPVKPVRPASGYLPQ